jgi:hypothetical protein
MAFAVNIAVIDNLLSFFQMQEAALGAASCSFLGHLVFKIDTLTNK